MKKKLSAITTSILLISVLIVGTSLAWLFDSKEVKNTFTVGDINLTLGEPNYVGDENAKIYSGAIIPKDPTVTITANSEDSFVFVCVENNLKINSTSIATLDINQESWIPVATSDNKTIYKYKSTVATSTTDTVLPKVFTTVTIDGDKVTKENINTLKEQTIVVKAYAHQTAEQTFKNALDSFKNQLGGTWTDL